MCSRYGINQYTANWLRPYFHHEEEQAVGDVPCDSLSQEKSSIRAFRFDAAIFVAQCKTLWDFGFRTYDARLKSMIFRNRYSSSAMP